jgi:hypothetical protein
MFVPLAQKRAERPGLNAGQIPIDPQFSLWTGVKAAEQASLADALEGLQFEQGSPPQFHIVSSLLLSLHMSHLYFAEMGSKVEYSR